MPTLTDTGRPSSAQVGVDGVVELVVERVLVHERRDPHESDGRVPGQGAQPRDLADGPVGAVGGQRDTQAIGVGRHLIEQRARLLRRDAGGDDADVDAARIHGDEQVLHRRGGGQVAPEQLGDALVAGWRRNAAAALSLSALTQRSTTVTPGRTRRRAGASWPAALACAFALAARR